MQKVKINMHYLKRERDTLHIPFKISKSCPASSSWLHFKYFEYTIRVFSSLSELSTYIYSNRGIFDLKILCKVRILN